MDYSFEEYRKMSNEEKEKYFNECINKASDGAENLKKNAELLLQSPFISAKSKAMMLSIVTDTQYIMAVIKKYRDHEIGLCDSELMECMNVIFHQTIKKMDYCQKVVDQELMEGVKSEVKKAINIPDNAEISDEELDEFISGIAKTICDEAEKKAREQLHKKSED